MAIDDFEELRVYRTAYRQAMTIFESFKEWPKVERYALTDQIRRSSRGGCSNIAETWSKRRYPNHFISTLSDAEREAAETLTWLAFANSCEYLTDAEHDDFRAEYPQIRGGLVKMMRNPDQWCGPSTLREPRVDYETNGDENGRRESK